MLTRAEILLLHSLVEDLKVYSEPSEETSLNTLLNKLDQMFKETQS